MPSPQAKLIIAKLNKLHPTQMTVGKAEVALKRKEWTKLGKTARKSALDNHWFPSILGPEDRYYITDHHHFGLALLEEDVKMVSLIVQNDLSWLEPAKFWTVMDLRQWAHPYDSNGIRREFEAVPKSLADLHDDPYRSLAGESMRSGAFAKDDTPFSEFLWADFFRGRISLDTLNADFAKAVTKAIKLARIKEARYLPGWSGKKEN